ncbi:MAG: hypothetical protein NC489_43930, partial [Ruminococcus flavefaciens]|nr:hypothetical protein [Ruminococcus flavefaciens]
FGFAACGETNDDAMYKIYTEYVATVPEGQTAKTYEDWLKETLTAAAEKGDKGDQGTPGNDGKSAYDLYKENLPATETPLTLEQWLQSLYGAQGNPGEDGISITGVKLSTDGKKLVFSFTEGADVELTLPESITHVHTYDEGYTALLLAPTDETEGLAYKVCKDANCDHIELVVVPTYAYKVTVYLSDGSLAEGATVTLKKGTTTVATATTDEKGEAIFANSIEKGEYDIEVAKTGYASALEALPAWYLEEAPEEMNLASATSATVSEYAAILVTVPTEGNGEEDTPYQLTSVLEHEIYHLEAPVILEYDLWEDEEFEVIGDIYFEFTATKYGLYNFSVLQSYVNVVAGSSYETSQSIPLDEGDMVELTLQNNVEAEYIDLMVSYIEAKAGSSLIPHSFEAGEEVSVAPCEDEDDEYTYFVLASRGKYQFEVPSGLTLRYLGSDVSDNGTAVTNGQIVDCSAYGKHYFKAKTTAAAIEFSAELYYYEGEKGNPVATTLGDATTPSADNFYAEDDWSAPYAWYKVTLEEGANYVLTNNTNVDIEVYSDLTESMSDVTAPFSKLIAFKATAGTYYFTLEKKYVSYGNYDNVTGSFTVSAYNAATHAGLLKEEPAALTDEATLIADASSMYFVYTAAADGTVAFSSDETVEVFTDAAYENDTGTTCTVTEGQKLYVKVNILGNGNSVTAMFAAADAKLTYTVILEDDFGDAVNGLTVKLMSGTTEVATAVTADGVATFNNVTAGTYIVSVVTAESDYELRYTGYDVTYSVSLGNKDITVELLKKTTYTFHLTLDEGLTGVDLSGVKATVNGEQLTFEEGTATYSAFTGGYRVSLSDLPAGYEYDFDGTTQNEYGETYNATWATVGEEQEHNGYEYTFTVKEKTNSDVSEIEYEKVTLSSNWSAMKDTGEYAYEFEVDTDNLNVTVCQPWSGSIKSLVYFDAYGGEYEIVTDGVVNIPTMISYKVSSNEDGITISDCLGPYQGDPGETIKVVFALTNGDMLQVQVAQSND